MSNPDTEDEDRRAGLLGDVNSITAISFSSKSDVATIGKFGVGFKAVFTYTETPHIYGPTLHFKIERFIVPRLLNRDHPERRDRETLFVFPFDKDSMPQEVAVKQITERLRWLDNPVLFLNHLERIDYSTPSGPGMYTEDVLFKLKVDNEDTDGVEDLSVEKLRLESRRQGELHTDDMWLISSTASDGFKCSVGFYVDEKGALRPESKRAYCFFPTKVSTGLKFIINAPFLLTDSREGIKYGDSHNKMMIERLGELAAVSLDFLCKVGEQTGQRIITENMFDVIPYKKRYLYSFLEPDDEVSFEPIDKALRDVVRHGSVLPCANGYRGPRGSFVMESARMAELIDDERLRAFVGREDVGQVLQGLNYNRMNTDLRQFLLSIGIRFMTDDVLLDGLSEQFIVEQDYEWINKLHVFIAESVERTEKAKHLPVFVDSEGKACRAYDERGNERLFLPSEDSSGYHVLSRRALESNGTKKLVELYQLKEPSLKDMVFSRVLPYFSKYDDSRNEKYFRIIYKHYKSEGESRALLEQISEYSFLAYTQFGEPQEACGVADDLYFPTERLITYFSPKPDAKFVDLDFYRNVIDNKEDLYEFMRGLGVHERPKVISRTLSHDAALSMDREWEYCTSGRPESWVETNLDGLREALHYLDDIEDWDFSALLWAVLTEFIDCECRGRPLSERLAGVHKYFYRSSGEEEYEPEELSYLKERAWLCDRDDRPIVPHGSDKTRLSDRYDTSSHSGSVLSDFLGLKKPIAKELTKQEKMASEFDDFLREHAGISMEDLLDDPDKLGELSKFLTGLDDMS